ncbi:MAG: RusA family crossover junction endodeoxyribonuclease [Leptospiraceae bacterium]
MAKRKRISLDLPYPPTVNTYWRKYRGKMVLSAKGRSYKEAVRYPVLSKTRGHVFKDPDPLRVIAILFPPDRRKRDIDNSLKALLDALGNDVLYSDDSQISEIHVYRGDVHRAQGGRVAITIERI